MRPVHAACKKKSYADTLKSCDSDGVNVRDENYLFPLMLVLLLPLTKKNIKEVLAIITFLISKGADVSCQDRHSNTVLHRIAYSVHRVTNTKKVIMPILKLLIKHGADPSIKNKSGETCYKIAYERRARKVGDFLSFGYTDYVDGGVRNRRSEVVHLLLHENIGNQNTFNPYIEINDVNAKDQNDLTAHLLHCILTATKKNIKERLTIISFYISKGADLNYKDSRGNTVLHRIAYSVHRVTNTKKVLMPILKLFIKHGADPSIKNKSGETCYKIAYERRARKVGDFLSFGYTDYVDGGVRNRRSEVVHLLLHENIGNQNTFNPYIEINDVNAKDQNDLTAHLLHCILTATKKNIKERLTIISFYISKGADLNYKDSRGNTVLHRIAESLCRVTDDKNVILPILELLICHNADPSIKNMFGKTCYDIANEIGARKVGDFINRSSRDYVDGAAKNQQPEFVHQPIYENIENNFNNVNINPSFTNNDDVYFANASAPPMLD